MNFTLYTQATRISTNQKTTKLIYATTTLLHIYTHIYIYIITPLFVWRHQRSYKLRNNAW